MTEGIASSEQANLYFNTIDKVHEILERDNNLASDVPSCVVVGMQSAGKYSVLSRISGIPFPQDSGVCNRVAIELRLRRALVTDSDSDYNVRSTLLIKAGDMPDIEVDKIEKTGFESALVKAQQDVLGGGEFEDKKSVKVEKEDKDIPDVTLIGLPGVFFSRTEAEDCLERQVQDMIKERVQNRMAMILHIVPINQDTDTMSTWR